MSASLLFLVALVIAPPSTPSQPTAPATTPVTTAPEAPATSASQPSTPTGTPATSAEPTKSTGPIKSDRWTAEIPSEMKEATVWNQLLDELNAHDLAFGAMAAASRTLIFFNDLPTKEKAYKTIIHVVDRGFPYSTLGYFVSGDIEPRDEYEFSNSYNLYKAILNREKGMERWAEAYFSNVDKENFAKYQFYIALDQYAKGDLEHSEATLKKILAKDWGRDQLPFIRKVARTIARIHFDREEYEKSLDIYKSFLLKLSPVVPSDWLEAAWNLYYTKHYPEALGYIYNLESGAGDPSLELEKYSLRALIYKSLCRADNFESLGEAFRKQFGDVVDGLKKGESFTQFPLLKTFKVPGNAEYQQVNQTLEALKDEAKWKSKNPEVEKLRQFLYDSEIGVMSQRLKGLEYAALERSAGRVLLMAEQLRFMKFEVARQKFNPESVFIPSTLGDQRLTGAKRDRYQIRWAQYGDFWRDERLNYKGVIDHQCVD